MKIHEKFNSFKDFANQAETIFRCLSMETSGEYSYNELYKFNIAIGGRNGGIDHRVIEVFWGARPFDSKTIFSGLGVSKSILAENGALLRYCQLDNGNVIVSVAPAMSEGLRPIENALIIETITNLRRLSSKRVIKSHWRYLKAYMDATALEGSKSYKSDVIIWYLRTFKKYFAGDFLHDSKASNAFRGVIKFTATVGLSGFIFYAVDYFKNERNNQTQAALHSLLIQTQVMTKDVKDLTKKIDSSYQSIRSTTIDTALSQSIAKNDSSLSHALPKMRVDTSKQKATQGLIPDRRLEINLDSLKGQLIIDSKDSPISKHIPWIVASVISAVSLIISFLVGKKQSKTELIKINNENTNALLSLKANVLSANRQAWINDLRNETSKFLGIAQDLRTEYATQMSETGKFDDNEIYKSHRLNLHTLAVKIEFMLNANESVTVDILAAIKKIRDNLYVEQAKDFDDACSLLIERTKDVLKSEWVRVKNFA